MAVYLTYLNPLVSAVLALACWWLYRDGRGRRMAAKAAKLPDGVSWESEMLARVVGHDLRIGVLERAISVVPAKLPGRLPLPPMLPPDFPRPPTIFPPPDDPRPSRSPEAVEATVAELRGETEGSPVDMRGDRSADNGPLSPRLAASEDAPPTQHATAPGDDGRRTSSRPPPPVVVVPAPRSERPGTRRSPPVFRPRGDGSVIVRARTTEGKPLADVPARPALRADGAVPSTLPPPGVVRERRTGPTMGTSVIDLDMRPENEPGRRREGWDLRCETRFETLTREATQAGEDVMHCLAPSGACRGIVRCACNCKPCSRRRELGDQAWLEIKGPFA